MVCRKSTADYFFKTVSKKGYGFVCIIERENAMEENGIGSYYRFLQGDKKSFERIVELYSDSLVNFSYGFLRDRAAAEDVMMDTFVSIIVKKPKFRQESAFKTYLFRTARNKSVDYLRRKKHVLPSKYVDGADGIAVADPESDFLHDERKRQLFAAMKRLPEQYDAVLYLVYLESFSVKEAGMVLGKSTKQIYNLLARAKASLKEILSKEGFEL